MVQEPQLRLGRWCSLADILGVCPSEAVLSFYFGYMRRQLVEEYLRFLTTRGSAELDEYGEIIDSSSWVRHQLTQKFCPAPQGGSPTVNRGEPGFKGRIGCAGFVHPSHRAHRWAKVCF